MSIKEKLAELGIELPKPAAPVANYVGYVISGKQIFISGQLPMESGKIDDKHKGNFGSSTDDIEIGKEAARLSAVNLLCQLNDALDGDLEKVRNCVKLGIFVSSTADFKNHPQIANGASDLIVEVFGDKGKHARAAVGVSSLPLGVLVEVDGIFEIE